MYVSNLCFGIVTAQPLPQLCAFPIYVSDGEITVELSVNRDQVLLTAEQILELREFYTTVLRDVLKVLQPFLLINNSDDAEMFLLVPIRKDVVEIDFDVVRKHKRVQEPKPPSHEERVSLEVTEEDFLGKIVWPWYRHNNTFMSQSQVFGLLF